MWNIGLYFVTLMNIIFLTKWIYRWRNPKCSSNGILPPGSSGLPFIGETLHLIIPTYSFDLHPFIKKRLQRYGPLFRTNVVGQNVVVSCDQEFNSFLFQQEEKLVVRSYLDLFEKMFKQGEIRNDGLSIHKYLRNLVLSQFGVDCIKTTLLSQFDQHVRGTLRSWSMRNSIEFESASVAMFGEFGVRQLYSYDSERLKEFGNMFMNISTGAMSFPLNIPGTKYYRCLKDKEKVLKLIGDVVGARLVALPQYMNQNDLLNKLIKEVNAVDFLTPEFVTQLLFNLSFVAFHSIPSILAFALKFVSENPPVLQELIVINETLRLANSGPGFMRKAIKDIEVNGYTIPAGWNIMACNIVTHLDPNLYKDPLKFNPWRWKDVTPEVICKNLTPFGGGIKQCAGAEFSRTSMSIFLHVLLTKYRWNIIKGGHIIQDPILHFKNGLHISIRAKDSF